MHRLIILVLFVVLSSCNNTTQKPESTTADTVRVNLGNDAAEAPMYQSIIFGKYCGFCGNNCTDMYGYFLNDNGSSLFADTTDSFLKKDGTFDFRVQLPRDVIPMVDSLIRSLPSQVRNSSGRFGCPDCADQCGLYLETIEYYSSKRRKFYFDTDTAQVPKELRNFVAQLHNTVNRLKQD